jgi:hypothetical protein
MKGGQEDGGGGNLRFDAGIGQVGGSGAEIY